MSEIMSKFHSGFLNSQNAFNNNARVFCLGMIWFAIGKLSAKIPSSANKQLLLGKNLQYDQSSTSKIEVRKVKVKIIELPISASA